MRVFVRTALTGIVLLCSLTAMGTDWAQSLYLGNGGYWRQRLRVQVHNAGSHDARGLPVAVLIGPGPGQANLAEVPAESVRVLDAEAAEVLYAVTGPDGHRIARGPIPAGSSLIVPAVCAAGGTTSLYVYFDNPAAWAVPDFLTASLGVQNGSLEDGAGATPAGWMHDYGDAQHVASWITERAHTGTHALKLWVAEGAAPTWISTRQSDIAIRPGAHYILSGWVKAENVSAGGYAGLYIHVGNAADPMLLNPPVSAGDGTYDWREVRFEFDAPETADRAELGTVLWGTGTAWFDDISLECTTPPDISAVAALPEAITVAETGVSDEWYDDDTGDGLIWDYRVSVRVTNLADADRPGLALIDLSPFLERRLGINVNSVRVVDGTAPVSHYLVGRSLLFETLAPARSAHTCYVYLSTDARIPSGAASNYAGLLTSAYNLVQNPSFESGTSLPTGWDPGWSPAGVTMSLDSPGRFGERAARLTVTDVVPLDSWPGWHQDTPVMPNATCFYGAWLKTRDVKDGEVALYAHYRTVSHDLSSYAQYAEAGPGQSGTADWSLLSGIFTMPPDCVDFQLHLTMNAHGTVWHDGVVLAPVIPATTGDLETRDATPGSTAWAVNALVKIFPDDPAPTLPAAARIAAARNEYEPLQLALRSSVALPGLEIAVDAPRNGRGGTLDEFEGAVVGYVPIDHASGYYQSSSPAWQRRYPLSQGQSDGWPGWWPDPLLPTRRLDLQANRTQPIWITIRVPGNAIPGDYRGAVRVTGASGILKTIPFTVHVYNFTLPEERHLAAVYDVRSNDWWGTPEQVRPGLDEFMSEHRLSPDGIYPGPVITYANGRVTADFTAFDAAAEHYFNDLKMPHTYTPGLFYLFGWGMPPGPFAGEAPYPGTYPYADADPSRLRPEYKAAYQACLSAYWEHMKAKGWAEKVVMYLSDEPFAREPRIIAQLRALADMVHEVDPAIPIYVSTWQYVPEWDGYIDIWGLGHYGGVSPEQLEQLRAKGDRIRYTTDGQMCIDAPYLAVERLLPYYCEKYGVEGYEFWGFNWLMDYDPYEFGWFPYLLQTDRPGNSYWVRYPNGDGFLAYPGGPVGHEGPVASLRAEQAREGMEDYEYLWLLRKFIADDQSKGIDTGRDEAALARAESLVRIPNAGGKSSSLILPDPDAVFAAREEVALAIELHTTVHRRRSVLHP